MQVDLKNKRKEELEHMIEGRKEEVVLAAIEVFKEKGIDNTKMTDVAKKAEIGVASVYRYFKTKLDLTIEAAMMVWTQEMDDLYARYESKAAKAEDGITSVEGILTVFIELFEHHPEFLTFIHEFDGYMVREQVDQEKLEAYENGIVDVKHMLISALEKGMADGSIRQGIDAEAYYYTTTHALMSLAQKLLLRGHILNSDDRVSDKRQIQMLIRMVVDYLKP